MKKITFDAMIRGCLIGIALYHFFPKQSFGMFCLYAFALSILLAALRELCDDV